MSRQKPGETMYLLKGIPIAVWDRAKAAAAAERPPLSMRWVLIKLLEKWLDAQPAAKAAGGAATPKPERKRTPRPPKVSAPADPVPTDALDLADSF